MSSTSEQPDETYVGYTELVTYVNQRKKKIVLGFLDKLARNDHHIRRPDVNFLSFLREDPLSKQSGKAGEL